MTMFRVVYSNWSDAILKNYTIVCGIDSLATSYSIKLESIWEDNANVYLHMYNFLNTPILWSCIYINLKKFGLELGVIVVSILLLTWISFVRIYIPAQTTPAEDSTVYWYIGDTGDIE